METITIKNLSTLYDYSALIAAAFYIKGGDEMVKEEFEGKIKVTARGNTFTVTDAEVE